MRQLLHVHEKRKMLAWESTLKSESNIVRFSITNEMNVCPSRRPVIELIVRVREASTNLV
jgi:hypothetical protein